MPIPVASTAHTRPSPSEEILAVAIQQFAAAGFVGTSLQQIADAAGYSKSSVLYHFASKEALLEAALAPTIDALDALLASVTDVGASPERRVAFAERFVDFLLAHRLQVHTFINQGQSLVGVPVIDRANTTLQRLAESASADLQSVEDKIRFGVALGGAAYTLVAGATFSDDNLPEEQLREALVPIVADLLTPVTPLSSSR